jgi:ABC-type multidrug transport system fused ATPase/permease subunit
MFKTLKTFFHFIAERRLIYTAYVLLLIISSIISNISPYFYKLFVDAAPSQNFGRLFNILLIFIGASVGGLLIAELAYWIGNIILADSSAQARTTIFAKIQDLDIAFHSDKSTGSLISIFKRGDGAFSDLSFTVHQRLLDIFISFSVMFFFFVNLDPRIALITLVSIIATLIATKFLLQNNAAKRKAFLDNEDKVTDIITDNLINYETVKLFAREKWEHARLTNAFSPWKKTYMKFSNTYRTIDFVIGAIINFGIFGMLLFSIMQITHLRMTIGDFVLVVGFIGSVFPRLWDLVWSFRDITRAYADIEKYFNILDFETEVKDPVNPVKVDHVYGAIDFNDVHFTYNGRTRNAINGLNLKINQGQSVALVGRSGSGKTTLAKLLMRFYDLDSGTIIIDGIDIKDFTKSDLRSFVGVVPQEPILFNNTIAYNIGYGFKGGSEEGPTLSRIRSAAKLANIDGFIESLKNKYETEVGERGVKLSGGQKQRLAIARMILSDPDIVVFDEATSNLDSESEKLIQDAFWKARRGKTTIIIAHRLSTVMRADKIIVMEHGKIKEAGTHESLLKNKNSLYSHFWNLQIKLD